MEDILDMIVNDKYRYNIKRSIFIKGYLIQLLCSNYKYPIVLIV